MSRSTKTTLICAVLACSALIGGSALAQRNVAVQPSAESQQTMPSIAEVGVVLDFAYKQPEFREALKPRNSEKIRALLLSYGLSETVGVYDSPMNSSVPSGPYTNCRPATINVYYPSPAYSWPNNPRTIIITICDNSVGGVSDFDWY